jgi:KDO2-lipid IV(A) lauroyltransferase
MMSGWIKKYVAHLTLGRVQTLGRMLGSLLFLVLRDFRRIARRNLQFVYPHWSPQRAQRFTREVFQQLGMTIVETAWMGCLSRSQCLRHIKVEGATYLNEAIEGGHGIIIISAHLGNWESALQFFPLYFHKPLLAVVKPLKLGFADSWVQNLRTRFGNQMVPKKKAFGKLLRTLRQGGAVGLMIDVASKKRGVSARFMGYRASATPAAAMLAMRSKSPVLPMICTRAPNGRLILRVEPPVPIRRTANLRADLLYNVQRMTDIIEQAVLQKPEQWLWLQKRWKRYYPDLYHDHHLVAGRRKDKQKG